VGGGFSFRHNFHVGGDARERGGRDDNTQGSNGRHDNTKGGCRCVAEGMTNLSLQRRELSGSVHGYCLTQLNENDLYGTSCSIMLYVAQAVQS
jgi:hypothetical protein